MLDAQVEAVDVLLQVAGRAGLVRAVLTAKAPDLLVYAAHVRLQRALARQLLAAQRAAHLGYS